MRISARPETDVHVFLNGELAGTVRVERTIALPLSGTSFEIMTTVTNLKHKGPNDGLWGEMGLRLGATDGLTLIAPGMGSNATRTLALSRDECQTDIPFTREQLHGGITLANHGDDVGVRFTPSTDNLEEGGLHVDARRSLITFRLKTASDLPVGGKTRSESWRGQTDRH